MKNNNLKILDKTSLIMISGGESGWYYLGRLCGKIRDKLHDFNKNPGKYLGNIEMD